MTREAWQKRQDQWKRFQAWEATHRMVAFNAAQRLAEVGVLVDLAHEARHVDPEIADVEALVSGIRVMRQRLAVLHRLA